MKRIISVFLTIVLLACFSTLTVFANEIDKHFKSSIEVEMPEGKYEIGRPEKITINFPKFNNDKGDYLKVDGVMYYNLHVQLVSISDTNGILKFSRAVDDTYTSYTRFVSPTKSGETEIVMEFQVYGFNDNSDDVPIPGDGWKTTITKKIKVEEMEVESGYFENSSEETFDINEFYKQEGKNEETSSIDATNSSDVDVNNTNGKNNVLTTVIIIVAIVAVLGAIAYFVIQGGKGKRYKK